VKQGLERKSQSSIYSPSSFYDFNGGRDFFFGETELDLFLSFLTGDFDSEVWQYAFTGEP